MSGPVRRPTFLRSQEAWAGGDWLRVPGFGQTCDNACSRQL